MTKPNEPTERALLKACVARLAAAKREGRRVWWYKVHGGPMQQSGIPDLCVVVEGRVRWIELKRPSGAVTRIQAAVFSDMDAAGAEVHVVRTVEEFVRAVLDDA